MTFTEAAVEVLRRAGKPLHYKDIADLAVRENLLSHVGQDPEVTMGQRLAAMAKREEDRKVVAIAPEGTFALVEWSVPLEVIVEAKAPPLVPDEAQESPYRGREREPRPIHAQARRRMEALLGHEAEPDEGERRRKVPGGRRFPPPAEVVFEALAQRQQGVELAELAEQLLAKGLLSEPLVRDLPSLTAALLEDNRRRTEAGRKPAFIVDGGRVTLVEFPPPSSLGEAPERAPQTALGRPPAAAALVAEFRRATVRALRRRLADLEAPGFEVVCAALLEKMGMRDVRVAKRSKEGPLHLARQRRGVSDLRVAIRLVRGVREIARQDVQDLRKDLAHYSAQLGIVLAPGEAGREARAEASAAGQPPVALYAGEALAEELAFLRVGVSVQTVELADVDEAFFAAAARTASRSDGERRDGGERREGDRRQTERGTGETIPTPAPAAVPEKAPPGGRERSPSERAEGISTTVALSEAGMATESAPAAAASVSEPAENPSTDQGEKPGPDENARRRFGRRDSERARITSPADQAWGQPAGTPRQRFELPQPVAMDVGAQDPAPENAARNETLPPPPPPSNGEESGEPE